MELRQWNSKQGGAGIEQVIETAYLAFGGARTRSEFRATETAIAVTSKQPRQFLYLVDGELVVASVGVVLRRGLAVNSLNLFVMFVNTHPDYRKIGLMEELFNQLLKYYERGDLTHEKWDVDDQTLEDASRFKNDWFRPYENVFWTLYSAVGTYYERFGFVPNYEFVPYIKQVPVVEQQFRVENGERVLFWPQDAHLLVDKQLLPPNNYSILDRNASLQETPFEEYVTRFRGYCEFTGLHFDGQMGFQTGKDEITRVFFAPDIRLGGLCIHRVWSNVNCKNTLLVQLQRVFAYIEACAAWFSRFPVVNASSVTVKLAAADFMLLGKCSFQDIEHALAEFGYVRHTMGALVPMAKDFGESGVFKEARWPYIGYALN